MAIIDLKNGKYKVKVSYRVGDKIKTKEKTVKTLTEAKRVDLEFKRGNLNLTIPRFKDLHNQILLEKKSNSKLRTVRDYEQVYNHYLSILANKKIDKITPSDLLKVKNSLPEKLSVTYKNKIISRLKTYIKYASKYYDTKDFSNVLESFKSHEIQEPMNIWTPEEFKLFISYCERVDYRDFFITLYTTGLRLGELLALFKADLKGTSIEITKTTHNRKEGLITPKNQSSIRTITLDSVTYEILLKRSKRTGKYMFGDLKPFSKTNVSRVFQGTIEKAQSEHPEFQRIRIHDLRHSSVSYLINNGANIVAVSKRLGHSTIEQTLNTYTHLFKESDDSLVKLFDDLSF